MILQQLKRLAHSQAELFTLQDTIVLYKIKNKLRSHGLTRTMQLFTLIGTGGFVWLGEGFYMLCHKKTRLNGFLLLFGIGENVVFNNLMTKLVFRRQRPCQRFPEEYVDYSFPKGYSFPSGHTLTSFTSATILTLINPVNGVWAYPLAAVISFSRVYLFVHYPSDVIAGMVDGIISGIVIYKTGHALYNEHTFPFFNYMIDRDYFFDRPEKIIPIFNDTNDPRPVQSE